MYALPQGCSAKRQIILNEPTFVYHFLTLKTSLLIGVWKMMKNLTICEHKQKAPPIA